MILADTSVWVDHLRQGDARLAALLGSGQIACHPYIAGEIALGTPRQRAVVLDALDNLPALVVASASEVRTFIEDNALMGRGIGWVDAHLLAGCLLTPGSTLWTRDRRLRSISTELDLDSGED